MKNLIKKTPDILRFKANSFDAGTYGVEINGNKYTMNLGIGGVGCIKPPEVEKYPPYDSQDLNFGKNLIDPVGEMSRGRIYPGQHLYDENFIPGATMSIRVPAEHVASGKIKIYNESGKINPDDVITIDSGYEWNIENIKLGSLWNLNIDGDPRFQNTTVLIIRVMGRRLDFLYQTKVIYSPEYHHIECAEGSIEIPLGTDGVEEVANKVHLTLINDDSNGGSIMDRQNEDEIVYPRSYSIGGYREQYPPVEFRKRQAPQEFDPEDEMY